MPCVTGHVLVLNLQILQSVFVFIIKSALKHIRIIIKEVIRDEKTIL